MREGGRAVCDAFCICRIVVAFVYLSKKWEVIFTYNSVAETDNSIFVIKNEFISLGNSNCIKMHFFPPLESIRYTGHLSVNCVILNCPTEVSFGASEESR